jgi:peptidyl-prolyl cis-trans isomerase SurA
MKRFLLLLPLAILATASPVFAKTLTRVAAVVNNDIISTYQLDKAVLEALAKDAKGNQLTSKQFDELKARVLEQQINEKLVEQRIKELGLRVPDPELNAAIEDVQRKNNLTAAMLKQAVEAQGITFADYREQLKQEILRYKLLGREINYKVQVTTGEIREYFREHIDEYRAKPKVRVSSLSYELPKNVSADDMDAIRQQAQSTRDLLLNGEDFEKVLAAQGDKAFGGDMGNLVEEDLTEQLQQVLTGLDVGQVSEPIEMNNQLHLFMVTARNPGDINLFDRVKDDIEKIIEKEKTDQRFKEWAQELRDRGHIDIRI